MSSIPLPLKTCIDCGRTFPNTREHFHIQQKCRDPLMPRCKDCESVRHRAYYQRNRERLLAAVKDRQDQLWAGVAAGDPEALELIARQRLTKRIDQNQRRPAPGAFTKADILRLLHEQQGCCRWCGGPLGERWDIDHVVPLSRGGTHDPSNIVLACERCNISKHAKLLGEWQPPLP